MYTDWFKLQKLPFRLRPDPDFLYLAGETGRLHEALQAAVARGRGLVCLLGEAGTGKTTLLQLVARECHASTTLAKVQQPELNPGELLATLAAQFGLALEEDARHQASSRLAQYVTTEAGHGCAVLIQVDEAHRCTEPMLRELMKLAGNSPAPLVLLAGKATLLTSLAAIEPNAAALPRDTLHLTRLAPSEIAGYLNYRLSVAGSEGRPLFEPDTMVEIMRYTGGTPKFINILCDSAMMFAEAHSTPRVGITEVRDAVQELHWVEFSARAVTATPAPGAATAARPRMLSAADAMLEVLRDGQFVSRLKLLPGRLVVGRAADAGLRLASQFVSREHCQFITTADQTTVEDLGSRNGILVNGDRRHFHRLQPDDRILIGDHTLVYLESPAADAQ